MPDNGKESGSTAPAANIESGRAPVEATTGTDTSVQGGQTETDITQVPDSSPIELPEDRF